MYCYKTCSCSRLYITGCYTTTHPSKKTGQPIQITINTYTRLPSRENIYKCTPASIPPVKSINYILCIILLVLKKGKYFMHVQPEGLKVTSVSSQLCSSEFPEPFAASTNTSSVTTQHWWWQN